jgi:hypothetical protein
MKTKTYFLIFCIISTIWIKNANATNYAWKGTTSTAWGNSANWNPVGVPGSNDSVKIVSATFDPALSASVTVIDFTINSGTLAMGAATLVITGNSYFNGGTITGSGPVALQPKGPYALFAGTQIQVQLYAVCGYIELSGSVFSDVSYIEQNGATNGIGNGGNTFSKKTTIVNSGSAILKLAETSRNIFNDTVIFTNTTRKDFIVSNKGKTEFNGAVYVNNTGSGGISFGNPVSTSGDTATLATGNTIAVGSTGFSAGTLLFLKFLQAGTTAQTLSLTGTSVLNIIKSAFNGKLTVDAPEVLAKYSTFDTLSVIQTGGTASVWSGKNIFNKPTTIKDHGDGNLQLSSDTADIYNNDVTFIADSTGRLYPCFKDTNYVKGNFTATGNEIVFANTSIVRFSGSSDQTINGSNEIVFNDFSIKKTSGIVTLNTRVKINGALQFNKGIILSDTTNLLTLISTSDARGASDSSFVDGPVKKIGNSGFVFPIGNYIHYRPLEISAPASSTDAFEAQYFDMGQISGDSLDTILKQISPCNYWMFLRKNGSSNVSVSVNYDTSYCSVFDTTHMRLALWNDTLWKDKGHGTFTGTAVSGKMTSAAAISNYGHFAIGTTLGPSNCVSPYDVYLTNTNATTYGSYTINNQSVLITGTFTVDHDFTFSNCQNIKMADDAKIVVNANKTLNINLCNISPCGTHQWDYIKINDYSATLNIVQSTLEGADSAIWSLDGGVYSVVRGSRINRCWKGIMVDAYSPPHTGIIQDSWIGCATVAGGSGAAFLYDPHTSQRTSKGIHVIDVTTSIAFGHSGVSNLDNNFFNMDKGIYATGSTLSVFNCNFDHIDNNGIAINALATSGAFSISVGNSDINRCNFTHCSKGIVTRGMDVTENFNHFDFVDYGIFAYQSQGKTLTMDRNEMNYFVTGIRVTTCANATVEINTNNFNAPNQVWLPVNLTYYGTSAIEASNHVAQPVTLQISSNYITNTRSGIFMQNVNGNAFNIYRIGSNVIYYQITYYDLMNSISFPNQHYGIRLNDCNFGAVTFNILYRDNNAYTSPINGDEWKYLFGIQDNSSTNVFIQRNDFRYISSAVNFRDVCSGSTVSCHDWAGLAQFSECYRGVDLGEIDNTGNGSIIATISSQGPGDFSNCWFANVLNYANSHRVAGRNSNQIQWAALTSSGSCFAFNAFTSTWHTVVPVTTGMATACPPFPNPFDRETLLGGIVQDTLIYSNFANERRYMQLSYAFRELDEDTAERLHIDSNDSIYIAFYNNYKNTNIGKFRRLQKLIDAENYSDALDTLAGITDTNTIETYRKTVLDLYLNIIEPGEDLSAEDSTDLATIANDCAIVGGPAVFEARAILEIEKKDSCVDAGERLAGSNSIHKLKLRNEDYLKLVPNPASDYVNVFYRFETGDAVLKISDITGKSVKEVNLPATGRAIKINTDNIGAGLYIYSINSIKGKIKTGKLIIK